LGDGTTSLATKSTKNTKENDKTAPWRVKTSNGSESDCHPEFPQWTNVIRPIVDHKAPKLFLNSGLAMRRSRVPSRAAHDLLIGAALIIV
jgi:hypothetical protein